MANTKRLRFLVPRGCGGIRFSAGAVADVPEPWASHFVTGGYAELADKPAAADADVKPAPKSRKKK